MTNSNDVRLNGDGAVAGESYGNVVINGAGTLTGDVDAASVRINGAGTAEGNVRATAIVVNGAGRFRESVHAEELVASGSATIDKDLEAGRLSVKGSVEVAGAVHATEIVLQGHLGCGGDCEAESLMGAGAFDVGGLLNAGRIELRIYGPSRARDIGCERIGVKAGRRVGWFWMWPEKRLTADSIEGDEIVLEYTTAQVVRGRNVRLGTGCDIGLVEYTGTFVRSDDAKVGEARKLQQAAS
jgi:cytoskeletal protein CcmA (bactofilin family)